METPATANSVNSDVLRNQNHYRLSQEEIAKAIRRHQREHPGARGITTKNPQKTTPRH